MIKSFLPAIKTQKIKYELQNLTQNGGILSSDLVYTTGGTGHSLTANEILPLSTANNWEFRTKYTYRSGGADFPTIFGYTGGVDYKHPCLIKEGTYIRFYLSSNGTSWNLNTSNSSLAPVDDTTYYLKVGFTGTEYYLDYNTTGWNDTFTRAFILNSTTKVYCSVPVMLMNLSLSDRYWNAGLMDLKETKFTVDDVVYEYSTSSQVSIPKPYIPARKALGITRYEARGIDAHGDLLINNLGISNFSSGTYAVTDTAIPAGSTNFEFGTKFTVGNNVSTLQYILGREYYFDLYIRYSGLTTDIGNGSSWISTTISGNTTLTNGSTYWAKVIFNGSQYIIQLSTDGTTYNNEIVISMSTPQPSHTIPLGNIVLANLSTLTAFGGTISLDDTYVKSDGNIVWQGEIVASHTPYEKDNVTLVGSPTLNNHTLSGFSTSNHAIANSNFTTNDVQSFEVVVHFNSGPWASSSNPYARIINGKLTGYDDSTTGCTIGLGNDSTYGNFCYMSFYNGSSYTECRVIRNGATDTDYWVKWTYDGTDWISSYSTDGETFTVTQTTQPSFQPRFSASQYYLGVREHVNSYDYETVFKGTLYLEDTYIKVNEQDYWKGVKRVTNNIYKPYIPTRKS